MTPIRMITISLLFFLFSCSAESSYEKDYAPTAVENTAASAAAYDQAEGDYSNLTASTQKRAGSPASTNNNTYEAPQRVLIQRAETRLEVKNMSEKVQRIEQLLTFYGGYVSDMNAQQMSYRHEVVMSLRLPADRFRTMLDSLRGMAVRVEHESVKAEDVTEEFIDIQSRLKTKKQVRDRYEDILRTKAQTVEEVLLAEEKIRRLQEEIEAKEGRLRYLANRSTMSSIQLSLHEPITEPIAVADSPAWYADFLDDTKNSLGFGFSMVKGIFLAILGLWPILLILGWLVYKRKKIFGFLRPVKE